MGRGMGMGGKGAFWRGAGFLNVARGMRREEDGDGDGDEHGNGNGGEGVFLR